MRELRVDKRFELAAAAVMLAVMLAVVMRAIVMRAIQLSQQLIPLFDRVLDYIAVELIPD